MDIVSAEKEGVAKTFEWVELKRLSAINIIYPWYYCYNQTD